MLIPIKTGIINEGDDPIDLIIDRLPLNVKEGDVLAVATKPLLKAYSKYIMLEEVSSDKYSIKLAEKYGNKSSLAALIIKYSDKILGGVKGFILSIVDGVILPNAGVDRKNVGVNRYALPFVEIKDKAREFYYRVLERYQVRIGVILVDSTIFPLRLGTRAIAVAIYGFIPIKNYIGTEDLYGVKIKYTYMNIADEMASAAHLVMGEGDEGIPAVLIRGYNINLIDKDTSDMAKIKFKDCLYNKLYD